MGSRCRVTFFDVEHHMRRTVEVDDPSPVSAIETALKRMLAAGLVQANFGEIVQVQTVTTADQWFQLSEAVQSGTQSKVA